MCFFSLSGFLSRAELGRSLLFPRVKEAASAGLSAAFRLLFLKLLSGLRRFVCAFCIFFAAGYVVSAALFCFGSAFLHGFGNRFRIFLIVFCHM